MFPVPAILRAVNIWPDYVDFLISEDGIDWDYEFYFERVA